MLRAKRRVQPAGHTEAGLDELRFACAAAFGGDGVACLGSGLVERVQQDRDFGNLPGGWNSLHILYRHVTQFGDVQQRS